MARPHTTEGEAVENGVLESGVLEDEAHERGAGGTRSWLLVAFPDPSQTGIFRRALAISLAIFVVEYVVEVWWLELPHWQSQESFVADPGVIGSAIGLVFGLTVLGQWGARYVERWEVVRPAFDVSREQYDRTVRRALDDVYGRDHVPFLLFVGVQLAVYSQFGDALPAGYLHVGVGHFVIVAAVYRFYRHTLAVDRVSQLDLVDLDRARPILSELADFSVIVCLYWFAALSAVAWYFLDASGAGRDVTVFYLLVLLALAAVGVLVFLIPVVQLHEALKRAKQAERRAIAASYDRLFEAWRVDDLERDPSVGLDLLETRRELLEARSTWPYRLASAGKVAIGAVVPTLLSIIKTLGLTG